LRIEEGGWRIQAAGYRWQVAGGRLQRKPYLFKKEFNEPGKIYP
jgi:hypothetical protein